MIHQKYKTKDIIQDIIEFDRLQVIIHGTGNHTWKTHPRLYSQGVHHIQHLLHLHSKMLTDSLMLLLLTDGLTLMLVK